jgi:2-deoxy-D-gluconate 3-dehydrogenase
MPGLADTPKGNVMDMFRLDGQTALVTGGSRGKFPLSSREMYRLVGIGASIAIALAQAGARIVLAQRDTSNTETQKAIQAAGGQADIVSCDLADRGDAEKVFDRALEVAGGIIDILVNNGGMLTRTDTVDVSMGEWDNVSSACGSIACAVFGQEGNPFRKQLFRTFSV